LRADLAQPVRLGRVDEALGEPADAALKRKGIIVSDKDGFLRAGVHVYNYEEDIDRAERSHGSVMLPWSKQACNWACGWLCPPAT
jgi:hypothetical protein